MKLSKRIFIPIRDRLNSRFRRYAEAFRVCLAFLACGGARFPRECNICGYRGKFYPAGFPSGLTLRLDAGCPECGSLDRHRLIKIWADKNTAIIEGRSVLHFAPERTIRKFMEPVCAQYIAADIDAHRSIDRQINIENIDAPDDAFDIIVCSHVLEHVDDKKALPELCRVLGKDGILLAMAPIIDAWPQTYENADIVSPRDRLLHFDQTDHVRFYGADIIQRFEAAGFDVSPMVASEPEVSRYGLLRGDRLLVCQKRSA